MALYLGIDIGTSASKGVLIDDRCNIVCQASCGHETDNPCDGWYQHDAEAVWWGDFCRLSRELVARSGVNAAQIGCVGLSALGCDCVPVDTECNALAPAILYGVDARSKPQIDELLSEYGSDRARELFGHDLCSSDIAPKILWFKENMPEVHERAAKFLTASSFLCAKLTGRFTVDRYLAEDFLPLYDRYTWKVDARECARFCRPDQMAEVMSATDIAGVITRRAAEATGLAAGTPVLVGTGDSGAEAISTGVFRPGDMMVQLGSTAYFIYLADHMIDDARLWPGTFIIPGTYGICAGTNTAGALTSWLRQELYRDAVEAEGHGGPDAYSVMAHDAADVAPGADGLLCLPYFAGGAYSAQRSRGAWRLLWPDRKAYASPYGSRRLGRRRVYRCIPCRHYRARAWTANWAHYACRRWNQESSLDAGYRRRMRARGLGCQGYGGRMLR